MEENQHSGQKKMLAVNVSANHYVHINTSDL